MKIAIHYNGERFFCKGWVRYCRENNIDYKVVNCYDSNIIEEISDCDVLMWHHRNTVFSDLLFAKQLLFAVEMSGKKVFPDFNTSWHFDDKLGQKYLFESLGLPAVKSYVFYSEKEAIKWAGLAAYPLVFKLRGGSGSQNVKLVKDRASAVRFIRRAFHRGFPQYDARGVFVDQVKKFRSHKTGIIQVAAAFVRLFTSRKYSREAGRERGYVYFQDFIPGNRFDIRVVIIGGRAIALKRMVRSDDFRASGSGDLIYNREEIDVNCIKAAFDANDRINAQSIAYDFVFGEGNKPLMVEISYGYDIDRYYDCQGFWDKDLVWHDEKIDPAGWMIEDLLLSMGER